MPKCYAVIHCNPYIATPCTFYKRKADAIAAAAKLLREVKSESHNKLVWTGSLHRDGEASLNYGCRNGYHIYCKLRVEERETRNHINFVLV